MSLGAILARLLPRPRVIMDREGSSPYLSRFYLLGNRFDASGARVGRSRLPFSLYLHKFHRSDDDGALHSHPWRWSFALILRGGYSEERRVGDRVERRFLPPGAVNFIRGSDYHRIDLLERDAWTLFLAGPKVGTWYFWDRDTGRRAHWRAFCDARRGLIPDAGWTADVASGVSGLPNPSGEVAARTALPSMNRVRVSARAAQPRGAAVGDAALGLRGEQSDEQVAP